MIKSYFKLLKWSIVSLLFVVAIEIFLRFIGIRPAHDSHFVAYPSRFFKDDSILGWKSEKGRFLLSKSKNTNTFPVEINKEGNRITSNDSDKAVNRTRPVIHIYGCESIFGFSVSDSATCGYKLQEMIPDHRVINKAVIGYGLAQMYLSLKQSLIKGDTPQIAIFNYGYFQDIRTPTHEFWSSIIEYSLTEGNTHRFDKMQYPYFEYSDDSLRLQYCPFGNMARDWPFRDKLSIINLLNTAKNFLPILLFNKNRRMHFISKKTANEIMRFCKLNHIIPIFACITPESKDILQDLYRKGYYVIDYDIMVYNKSHAPNEYNCGVLDPDHPNALAHTIFAQKMFAFLQTHTLLIAK